MTVTELIDKLKDIQVQNPDLEVLDADLFLIENITVRTATEREQEKFNMPKNYIQLEG